MDMGGILYNYSVRSFAGLLSLVAREPWLVRLSVSGANAVAPGPCSKHHTLYLHHHPPLRQPHPLDAQRHGRRRRKHAAVNSQVHKVQVALAGTAAADDGAPARPAQQHAEAEGGEAHAQAGADLGLVGRQAHHDDGRQGDEDAREEAVQHGDGDDAAQRRDGQHDVQAGDAQHGAEGGAQAEHDEAEDDEEGARDEQGTEVATVVVRPEIRPMVTRQ